MSRVRQRARLSRGVEEAPAAGEPLLISVPEAARLLGLGRTKLYELIATGEIEVVRIGRAARVPVASLRDFVDGCRTRHVG